MHRLTVAVALLLTLSACSHAVEGLDLGGGWTLRSRARLIEAGFAPSDLFRSAGLRSVLVDKDIGTYRFYAPDCLVYEAPRPGWPHMVFAVCGERAPVPIVGSDWHAWSIDADGVRYVAERFVEQGLPRVRSDFVPLDAITAAARAQGPFRADWADNASATGVLRPSKQIDPVDVTARDEDGRTILIATTTESGCPGGARVVLVKALLAAGADVDAQDQFGDTALMLAAALGDVEVMRALLDAHANMDLQDREGRTALILASQSFERPSEAVAALLEAGADADLRDRHGETAADKVRASKDIELTSLLGVR